MATQYVITTTAANNASSTAVVHTEMSTLETAAGSPNNEAGKAWATAYAEKFIPTGTVTSEVPPSIMPGGRQAELDNATRIEWSERYSYDANASPAAKAAAIEAEMATDEVEMISKIINELRWWGATGSL